MASLQERNGSFRVLFMHAGKLHAFTIGKVSRDEADTKASQVEYLLMRLKQQLITLPPGCDVVTFMEHDGKPPAEVIHKKEDLTLAALRDRYLETHSNGTLEKTTLGGIKQHFRHWTETLGDKHSVAKLSLADLQRHVDRRAKMKGAKGKVSAATIKKEIVTLRSVWNWAVQFGLVDGPFPNQGLRYPKMDEKPPFMTWDEIARMVKSDADADLWDCLYLRLHEIDQLLAHVKAVAAHPFIYPMFVFAAHTGARRSEMLRAQCSDIDLVGDTVLIHEKKRTRGKRSNRRMPLSPTLKAAMAEWLDVHPGGPHLFCQCGQVPRSQKKRPEPTPVTVDESHDHFKRTLSGKWEVLKGWHVLRHSFISACASRGVDQRLIDEWVGHTTEEMRQRYRHLYPSTQQAAIRSVFG